MKGLVPEINTGRITETKDSSFLMDKTSSKYFLDIVRSVALFAVNIFHSTEITRAADRYQANSCLNFFQLQI